MVITRGQNVTLRCAAESSTGIFVKIKGHFVLYLLHTGNLTITWLYEDNLLTDGDDRWQIDQFELRIVNVAGSEQTTTNNKTNAGNYACLVSNHFGAILSRIVKVEIASVFF